MVDDFIREITDLRCENSSLKYQLKKQKEINKKAIKYIKKCSHKFDGWDINIQLYEDEIQKLLQILEDKEV